MQSSKHVSFQNGFGLLEVLITIFVIGSVLLALVRLQVLLLQEGSYAKARSVALNLAQAKLEDLRSFQQLLAAGSGTFTYTDIGDNTGGVKKLDGTGTVVLAKPSGEVTVSNVTYTRLWTVESYYYCAENQTPSTSNCDPIKPYPDFKVVTVTVTWTAPVDPENIQLVELESAISASDPARGIRALILPASS